MGCGSTQPTHKEAHRRIQSWRRLVKADARQVIVHASADRSFTKRTDFRVSGILSGKELFG